MLPHPLPNAEIVLVLLRLLFPSWAFFDSVGDVPRLQARVQAHDGHFGPWCDVLHAPPRSWRTVLYHPNGTAHLALQTAVDRVAVECVQGEPDATSCEVVAAIAEREVRTWVALDGHNAAHWQWRIIATPVGSTTDDAAVVIYDGGVTS